MNRLFALLILGIGTIPCTMSAFSTSADEYDRSALDRQCRAELHYGSDATLSGSELHLLRTCINAEIRRIQQAKDLEELQQRYDQLFWRNYEYGQAILQESRRSLHDRIQSQNAIRKTFFTTVSRESREAVLAERRRAARTSVRLLEQSVLEQRRLLEKEQRRLNERCRTYSGELRYACLRGEI